MGVHPGMHSPWEGGHVHPLAPPKIRHWLDPLPSGKLEGVESHFLDVASVGCVVFTIDVVCPSVTLFRTSVFFLDTFPLNYDVAITIYDY